MKARTQLEERRDSAAYIDASFFGGSEPADQAEQRTLSGAVSAHNGDTLALVDPEGDILQGVKIMLPITAKPVAKMVTDQFLSGVPVKDLRDVLESDVSHRQR